MDKQVNEKGDENNVHECISALEEYRLKSEIEGNYLEANRALDQIHILQNTEIDRQVQAFRAKQIYKREWIRDAHEKQQKKYEEEWNDYLRDFEKVSEKAVKELMEKQKVYLMNFQEKLVNDLMSKPPKWSRELIQWRKRQHILADQKNYAEAQKLKSISDQMEEKERNSINEDLSETVQKKEHNLRKQQEAELQGLLKKIEVRKKQLKQQKENDLNRLLSRNQNVMSSIENKNSKEMDKKKEEVKGSLRIRSSAAKKKLYGQLS